MKLLLRVGEYILIGTLYFSREVTTRDCVLKCFTIQSPLTVQTASETTLYRVAIGQPYHMRAHGLIHIYMGVLDARL